MIHPFSTLTNLAYVLAGMAIALRGHPTGVFVGIAFVVLGMGSAWYHATRVAEHQLADERGMYLAFSMLIGATFTGVVPDLWLVGVMILATTMGVVLASVAAHPKVSSFTVIPVLVLSMLALLALNHDAMAALKLLVAFLAIEAWREIPENNFGPPRPAWVMRLYDPIHGIWHLVTAYLMYMSYVVATSG